MSGDCIVRSNATLPLRLVRRAVDEVLAETQDSPSPVFTTKMFCYTALIAGEFRCEEVAAMAGVSVSEAFAMMEEMRRSPSVELAQRVCRQALARARELSNPTSTVPPAAPHEPTGTDDFNF